MKSDKMVKSEIEREIERRKREKDEHDACIFASVFMVALGLTFIIGNLILIISTIVVFGTILYMDSQKEKVEKRLRTITKAYYEQMKKQMDEEQRESLHAEISVSKGGKVA